MPKHAVRLVLLLVIFGALAVAARYFLVDKSYYKYGYYRGDAVMEIAQDKPRYQGTAYCESCHSDKVSEWSKSVHNNPDAGKVVKCEVCHGPAGSRDPQQHYMHAATGRVHPDDLKMAIPTDTQALCKLCHEQTAGRPSQQRQIVVKDHAGALQCTLCHNPHSPGTFVGSLAAPEHRGDAEAGKGKIATCLDCHGANGISAGLPGPTLAGQNQTYLIATLTEYKTGKRNDPMMAPIAAAMSDADIKDIAAYFSSLKCKSAANTAEQTAAAHEAGASVCVNCHGANGSSADRGWPNLVGQSKDYIVGTLKAYAGGQRPNTAMNALAKGMNDADVEKLAAYYAGYSCK